MKEFILNKREYIVAGILWSVIFAVYLSTLAPAVGFIDSGELAAVACTLGIAHPTGYPLFTLIGRLFSMLPVSSEPIVRLNIMAAVFTSTSAVVFFFIIIEFLEKKGRRDSRIIAAGFGALALSFSRTFWEQSTSVEVYSLHLFLMCTTILFFLKAVHSDRKQWWLLFAYTLGLAFSNHLTTILLAPAFLYLFFIEHRFTVLALNRIKRLAVPFLLGLSSYLYLPLRASESPVLNWGNPSSLERLWWHVTGKQFRVWMFASSDAAKKQLDHFVHILPVEFYYIPFLFAIVGLFLLLFSDRKKFLFLFLLFAGCIAYSINYDIHDIDSYFLLAFVTTMIFASVAVHHLAESMSGRFPIGLTIILITIIGVEGSHNYSTVDQSDNYTVDDYATNILANLPPNALIISFEWDYFVSASLYLQHVKNYRRDVVVIDKELLRRSWYFNQLDIMYPDVMEKVKPEVERFLRELYKFEHGLPYEYSSIEGRYSEVIKSIIEQNINVRPCFITPEIERNYTKGYIRIPDGFGYRLANDTGYFSVAFPKIQHKSISYNGLFSLQIAKFSRSILLQRGQYEGYFNKDSLAREYELSANRYFPLQ